MIIGIDPSSTATGVAALTLAGAIVEMSVIRAPGKSIEVRLPVMARMVADWVEDQVRIAPHWMAGVEVPDRWIAPRRRDDQRENVRGGYALAAYGRAVGWIEATLVQAAYRWDSELKLARVRPVPAGVWCRRQSKATRAKQLAQRFPEVAGILRAEKGFNAGDALGVAAFVYDQIQAARLAPQKG